ncbi:MAG: hypothetical protein UY35_C0005G0138 [Candidatus Saccharibacteria bacterium GW2011_GWC2_48_9]|nr:MAG: hypothetical protein UY35_C0005G0138 [Candidatus Saccharibacteria bacterium GW2011_GWC2_48_9]HCH34862.1 hypothetical protein [Candidatus Saccharibacteria bacterium]
MITSTRRSSGSAPAIVSLIATILFLAAAGWLFLNRQYVLDQIVVWQYSPTKSIEQLVTESGMGEKGRFYFYASRPVLSDASSFNQECKRQEESSAILGCYSGRKIFIYDIADERLAGIKEVTAAHEMLHAAYERMPEEEKSRVNSLLDVEYQKVLAQSDDDALKERMAYYARTEPGEHNNELHSIIATEVKTVSSGLEEHYDTYFDDRQKVVALHGSYNSKFEELRQSSEQLKTELETLSDDINISSDQYNADISSLNADIEQFNAQADTGTYATETEFQAARAALLSRVDELKQRREVIDVKIANYEAKRLSYNKTVDESNSLTRSLDSSLAPAPSI